jgi:hypothetical protein
MRCRPVVEERAVVVRFEVRCGKRGGALLVDDGVTVAISYSYDAIRRSVPGGTDGGAVNVTSWDEVRLL